jgi:hypothetical protein
MKATPHSAPPLLGVVIVLHTLSHSSINSFTGRVNITPKFNNRLHGLANQRVLRDLFPANQIAVVSARFSKPYMNCIREPQRTATWLALHNQIGIYGDCHYGLAGCLKTYRKITKYKHCRLQVECKSIFDSEKLSFLFVFILVRIRYQYRYLCQINTLLLFSMH